MMRSIWRLSGQWRLRGPRRWGVLLVTLLVAVSILAAGCGAQRAKMTGAPGGPMEDGLGGGKEGKEKLSLALASGITDRKVIRNAELTLEVRDLEAALAAIADLVGKAGGYTSDATVSGMEKGSRSGSLTVRLPAGGFDSFLSAVAGIGNVAYRRVYSDDVTEEYIDLEARLPNLENQEKRLRELQATAKTVEDVLRVESELIRVRNEIDSLRGRLNYLKDRVAYSTIAIQLRETVLAEVKISGSGFSGLAQRARRAFVATTNYLINLAADVIVFLAGFLPVAVFLLLAGLAGRALLRATKGRLPRGFGLRHRDGSGPGASI